MVRCADVCDVMRGGHRPFQGKQECLCYLGAAEEEAVYAADYVAEIGFVAAL